MRRYTADGSSRSKRAELLGTTHVSAGDNEEDRMTQPEDNTLNAWEKRLLDWSYEDIERAASDEALHRKLLADLETTPEDAERCMAEYDLTRAVYMRMEADHAQMVWHRLMGFESGTTIIAWDLL
jgi:hypothetical protein